MVSTRHHADPPVQVNTPSVTSWHLSRLYNVLIRIRVCDVMRYQEEETLDAAAQPAKQHSSGHTASASDHSHAANQVT